MGQKIVALASPGKCDGWQRFFPDHPILLLFCGQFMLFQVPAKHSIIDPARPNFVPYETKVGSRGHLGNMTFHPGSGLRFYKVTARQAGARGRVKGGGKTSNIQHSTSNWGGANGGCNGRRRTCLNWLTGCRSIVCWLPSRQPPTNRWSGGLI